MTQPEVNWTNTAQGKSLVVWKVQEPKPGEGGLAGIRKKKGVTQGGLAVAEEFGDGEAAGAAIPGAGGGRV